MHPTLRFREAMEMKELNQDRRSPSVSTLKYEINSDCLTSSKRHGWAPPKNQSDTQGQRPLSFAGRHYSIAIGVDWCFLIQCRRNINIQCYYHIINFISQPLRPDHQRQSHLG